jgi:1-deoxy-D-xylulose-5-phosphate reductoisomerase
MGLPDMKLPIQFALTYPERLKTEFPRFNFLDHPQLTFEQADKDTFRNLQLAYDALEKGGTAACALNAANEISVQLFLEEKIGFLDIAKINESVMLQTPFISNPSYEDYVETDRLAREFAFK